MSVIDAATGRPGDFAERWRALEINAGVAAMAVSPGVLYIGGHFDRVEGQERPGLAALDAETGKVKQWRARIEGGISDVNAMHVLGSRLYVGGDFEGHLASFPPRPPLAAWPGEVDPAALPIRLPRTLRRVQHLQIDGEPLIDKQRFPLGGVSRDTCGRSSSRSALSTA